MLWLVHSPANTIGVTMRKFVALSFLVLVCLTLSGCTQDAAVNKFIADLDAATKEIVKPVDDSPTVAGVDAARKVFEGKRDGLREQLVKIRTGKVSAGVADRLTESV